AGVAFRSISAKERSRCNNERRGGYQERKLPGEPQTYRHASAGWRNASPQAANEIRRHQQQENAKDNSVPSSTEFSAPEPHPCHGEKDAGESQHSSRCGKSAQQRAVERCRREERLESE